MPVIDSGDNNIVEAPEKASVTINGSDNAVFIDETFSFDGFEVVIEGDGCIVNVEKMRRAGKVRLTLKNRGHIQIGEETTAESCYLLADGACVTIGRDCMISFNVSLRTTDAHGIYDAESGELLNPVKDVTIGDHVWLAQGVVLGKGTNVGCGSVVAANSYLNKKIIEKNVLVAGTPPKVLRENIIWDRRMTENLYEEGADVDPSNPIFIKERATENAIESPPILDVPTPLR